MRATSSILVLVAALAYCVRTTAGEAPGKGEIEGGSEKVQGKYAGVNGLKMYYEIHGTGEPLVLLHGGIATIDN